MSNFRDGDRQTAFLLPPSVDEWLPERHLARFIVEVIDGLDLGGMIGAYRGSGSAAHHPRMLLGVLIYGYATGMFSSRKLERATYDSVAFRYIAANDHPDHDTIAMFRRRFLEEIEGLFVRVLLLAREMGVLKMGTVGLDGTKIHASASRHSALSWDHAGKLEAQLKAEVADLLARAEAADEGDVPDGMSIPEELAVREKRLAKLAEARGKIEAQAKERYARERAEHEAKLAARAAKTAATGKKPGGKPPAPPVEGPLPKDQINLTDADSRIMPASGGGFEQSYNAQAVVAAGSLLVVAADVVQAPNDKQQLEPMLDKIEALPERLGAVETLLADAGYFSAANVEACREARLEPLIAIGREPHHPPLDERFAKERPAPENPTPVEAMAHRLKTPEGRKLYALRKQTPEPVFGIIKSALGFRQFSLRGRQSARRVEPRDHGVEPQADVRPRPRLTVPQASQPAEQASEATPLRPLNREWSRSNREGRRSSPKSPAARPSPRRKCQSDRLLGSGIFAARKP
jgi:transposase